MSTGRFHLKTRANKNHRRKYERLKKCNFLCVDYISASFSWALDWPHWRGPHYDGVSRETDLDPSALNDPLIVWEAKIGTGFSAVSVANGKAYTIGNVDDTDIVYCFDARTGKELWTFYLS